MSSIHTRCSLFLNNLQITDFYFSEHSNFTDTPKTHHRHTTDTPQTHYRHYKHTTDTLQTQDRHTTDYRYTTDNSPVSKTQYRQLCSFADTLQTNLCYLSHMPTPPKLSAHHWRTRLQSFIQASLVRLSSNLLWHTSIQSLAVYFLPHCQSLQITCPPPHHLLIPQSTCCCSTQNVYLHDTPKPPSVLSPSLPSSASHKAQYCTSLQLELLALNFSV